MSILDMVLSSVPSWLVRLMRALRVIRLFGRVKELRKMVTAVSASIFAMANAFFILVIILCICAQTPLRLLSHLPTTLTGLPQDEFRPLPVVEFPALRP
jgi:hypothetical protein